MATTAAAKTPAPRTSPLSEFVWEGTDKRGVKMKGESTSKNANLLRAELRKLGINPTIVKTKSKPLFGSAGKTISAQEIAVFARQIATMLQAGVPMVQSFEILASGQKNVRMRDMLMDIRDNISGGSSLSEAMARHPVQFDLLFRNLTRAGEGAGVLDTILDTVATYKERTEALKGKIKKALYYPTAVIAVAILVSSILLIYVVPQFKAVFQGFGADLPAFTQMIVNASEFMTSWWWAILLILAGSVAAFVFTYKRSPTLERTVDRILLKVPVLGQIMHQSAVARYCRTLALTFKAGVPLVDGLETVGGATGSIVYNDAVMRIREDVSVGYQLNVAMKQVNLFPHMVVQMTAIGEEAGALDSMLLKVAEFYEQEIDNSVDSLTSLLEPLIMVVIGVLVGGMVIGMYLPIFKLAAAV